MSVLIPSRGRPGKLTESVNSCFDRASDKSLIEVLIRIDEDDFDTWETCERLTRENQGRVKFRVGLRGRGYLDLHAWMNELAHQASGDWLLMFNDDARILTQEWDQVIMGLEQRFPYNDVCLIDLNMVGCEGYLAFIAIRRELFKHLGYVGPTTLYDTWLGSMADFLSVVINIPVDVEHIKDDDPTKTEGNELNGLAHSEVRSLKMVRKRLDDLGKLLARLKGDCVDVC